jgi:HAD superfamily hydrolase (TIGR01459 family)
MKPCWRRAAALILFANAAAGFHAPLAPLTRRAAWSRGAGPPRVRRCLAVLAAAAAPAALHGGLEELAERYDAFLIDQWGVMHNGKTAYPKAIECMARLAERGKKIVLLSNSSRRKGNSMKKLDAMGFASNTVIDVVTSGEMGWCGLAAPAAERRPPFDELQGNKVFVFGNGEEDDEYVKTAGLEFAEIEEADFILARGMFTMHDSEDVLFREGENKCSYWESEATRSLQIASLKQTPMLVTNPDFVRPDGNDSPMPGMLAASYENILAGGYCAKRRVFYVGKPHSLVYEEAFRLLKEDNAGVAIDLGRICGVGDSLLHDIQGARRAGIDSIFIANGIHAQKLNLQQGVPGQAVDTDKLQSLCKELMAPSPTHVVPHFQWSSR